MVGPSGAPGSPGLITDVQIASSNGDQNVGAYLAWEDLPGASATVTVPANAQQGTALVRFSAISKCVGSDGDTCLIRVMVDGVQADPSFGESSPQDSPVFDGVMPFAYGGQNHYVAQAQTIERSLAGLPPGQHVVVVQYRTQNGVSFEFYGWHLVAEIVSH